MDPRGADVERLADLCWLLAHDRQGSPLLGRDHLAIGLAAGVVGELLTQPSATVTRECLVADRVVGHALGDLYEAGRQHIVRSPRVWVEWLAGEHHQRTVGDITDRLVASGLAVQHGRHVQAVDGMTAFAPIARLTDALTSVHPIPAHTRLLAGVTLACGLAPAVAGNGEDLRRPLQLIAMDLPKPLFSLVTAVDDAIAALAMRRP